MAGLKFLAASREEPLARRSQSSIQLLSQRCSLTPPQAAGNARAGFNEHEPQFTEDGFNLVLETPRGKIKYTVAHTEGDDWFEIVNCQVMIPIGLNSSK